MQSYGHTNVHFITTLYNNAYVLHFLHCLSETLLVCSLCDIFSTTAELLTFFFARDTLGLFRISFCKYFKQRLILFGRFVHCNYFHFIVKIQTVVFYLIRFLTCHIHYVLIHAKFREPHVWLSFTVTLITVKLSSRTHFKSKLDLICSFYSTHYPSCDHVALHFSTFHVSMSFKLDNFAMIGLCYWQGFG